MPIEKEDCQAGLVTYPDGKKGILVAGGDYDSSSYFLDLETLTWERKASLPTDIHLGASVPFENSFLIVGGISDDIHEYLNTIFYYNPNLDQWELLSAFMHYERGRFAAFLVPDSYANCI